MTQDTGKIIYRYKVISGGEAFEVLGDEMTADSFGNVEVMLYGELQAQFYKADAWMRYDAEAHNRYQRVVQRLNDHPSSLFDRHIGGSSEGLRLRFEARVSIPEGVRFGGDAAGGVYYLEDGSLDGPLNAQFEAFVLGCIDVQDAAFDRAVGGVQ